MRSIVVCGDRNWSDLHTLHTALSAVEWEIFQITGEHPTIITGGCRGADEMADDLARRGNRDAMVFEAEWGEYGRAAGPIRNQRMLDEGRPLAVLAFHDNIEKSKGTKDMVKRAVRAGIPTILIGHETIRTW